MNAATDYFTLLELERKYRLDAALLRRQYYAHSRNTHPDRAALNDAEAQKKALENTAILNKALNTLSHPMQRLAHLLELEGHPLPENYALSPAFMMEMMELNELAEDNPEAAAKQTQELRGAWQQHLDQLVARYDAGEKTEVLFAALQEAYFRHKYLERIRG